MNISLKGIGLICFMAILQTVNSSVVAEYYFNSSAYSSRFQNLADSSGPDIIKPGDDRSSWSIFNPTLTDQGAYIIPNDFLWPTGNFPHMNNEYASFGVWIYYIQGKINRIMGVNVYLTTSSGTILTDIKLFHHTSLSGVIIAIDDKRYNFTMGEQIQAGWNWYGIGVNYTTVFWSLCNQHQ